MAAATPGNAFPAPGCSAQLACAGFYRCCRNVSKEDIEAFVKADPYVQNGLVPSHTIRPYMVVAGDTK